MFKVATESSLVAVSCLIGAICSIWFVKYMGRKALFVMGMTIVGISHGLIAYYIIQKNANFVLIFATIVEIFYQGTLGSGFYIYCAEVGNEISMGIAVFVMQAVTMLLTQTVPMIIEKFQV